MPRVAELMAYLERFAPRSQAAEWDNVGLLLGDADTPVHRLMTCLTVTPEVVAEAVEQKVDLIISHHPILFRGVKQLSSESAEGRLLGPLMKAGVAVYSAHTAWDNCPGGINDGLCRRLGLRDVEPLRWGDGPRQYKLVVFTPDADLAKVSDALFHAGAGVIGQYRECSFRLPGKGTFFGSEEANPTVGQKGRREEVDEWRLEVLVPHPRLAQAVQAMRQAHSYEEPAYDIYPLRTLGSPGLGRVGNLPQPLPLEQLVEIVQSALNAPSVQWVGDASRPVRRLALACGAAGEFFMDSAQAQADVFLTGEMRFHEVLAAQAAGLCLLLPGHYATERPGLEDLAGKIACDWPEITAWASQNERDPLRTSRMGPDARSL